MTSPSIRTKGVILEAARTEFAAHGLAGGRVDRIARAAGANVQRIYAYYTDKQGLFDAVVLDAAQSLATAIGSEQPDIESFARTTFDYLVSNPANTRTMTWARLERESEFFSMMDTGLTGPTPVSMVTKLQDTGLVTRDWDAVMILEAIITLCERWHSSASANGRGDVASHRELVLAFARTLATAPTTEPTSAPTTEPTSEPTAS